MTKLFKNGQKRGPLKGSDISRNSIVAFSISLFILQLKSSDAYTRIFKSFYQNDILWMDLGYLYC